MAGFTLVSTQTIIARNAGALYGLEVGNSNMTSYVSQVGSNVDAFLNTVYTNSVGTASTASVAAVLVANLGLTGAAATEGTNYIVAQLNAVPYTARGAVVNNILSAFSNLTSDATYGAAATAWNTKVSNAVAYAAVSGNQDSTFDSVSSTPVGQSFTLTTSLDVINGGSGADTVNAVLQGAAASGTTVAPGDVVNGGAGVDTLNISVAGSAGAAYTLSAVQTNAVEKVLLSQFDTDSVNATTVAADLMTGLTTVGFSASGADGDTTFSGLKNAVAAEMRNGAADLTLSYNSTVLSGTADTQALIVSGETAGTFTADGAETIAITSELAASKVTNVASNTLKTVTVAGSAGLTITTALTAATIDAAAATGAVNVTLGSATQKVTGGAGADVIDANTNLSSADTVAGGDGADTLKLSVGNATVAVGTAASKGALYNVTGFEVIDIASTNDAATLDLDTTTGVTTVVAAANTKTVTFATAAVNSTAIAFTLNGVSYSTAATDSSATVAEAGVLLTTKINSIAGFSASDDGNGVVTIVSTTGEAIEIGSFSGGMIAANTTVGAYSDVSFTNMAAGQAVDVYSADAVTATLKDASGTADALSINLKTTSGDKGFDKSVGTVTANNIETINLSANGMTDGKKTTVGALTGNAVKTLNITGDSDVTISAFTSSTALVTIDGSTASGDLSLAAAPAAKDQSIKTGSGNDTITMGAFLTAADTIDGGANNVPAGGTTTGIDTLTATGNIGTVTTAAALKIANVETIEVATGGAAATYIDAAAVTGATTMAFSATSGTVKLTNLAAGTAIGLGETTNTFTGTMDISLADATGAADSISFTTATADAANTVALTIAAAVETVNIAATTDATNARTATFTNTNNAAKNIVLTAGQAADTVALGTLNAATTNVDASKLAAKLTVTTAATGAVTVSANGTVANSVTTGAGADTITLAGKLGTTVQTIAGGTGNDVLNVQADNAATDFTSVSAVETINITVAGNNQAGFNNTTKDDGLNAATTVNILGGDSLSTFTIATAVLDDDAAGTTMKFDASTFGGAIDINAASDAFDAELSILGGVSTTDKVTAIIAGVDNKVALMSGVETLVLKSTDSDVAASADLTNVTGLVTVDAQFVTSTNADQIQVDKVAAGVKVKTTLTKTGDNLVVNLASIAGTSDALDLEVTEFSDGGVTTESLNFDAAGVETLNLSMKNTNAGKVDLGGVTATTGSTVTVNVSGTGVAELTSLSSSITNVVSTGTGALTIAAADRTASAMTITGGEGGDSIALKNASDVLTGGLGTDTLNVSFGAILGGIEVNLGATDQVVSLNGSANAAVQTGFENVDVSAFTGFGAVVTGSTGANTIVGTALADQITGGNGADVITGGAGNDVIDLTETTAAADKVTFTSDHAATAINNDNVDTITGFGNGDTLVFTGATLLTFVKGGVATGTVLDNSGTDSTTATSGAGAADAKIDFSVSSGVTTVTIDLDSDGTDTSYMTIKLVGTFTDLTKWQVAADGLTWIG